MEPFKNRISDDFCNAIDSNQLTLLKELECTDFDCWTLSYAPIKCSQERNSDKPFSYAGNITPQSAYRVVL